MFDTALSGMMFAAPVARLFIAFPVTGRRRVCIGAPGPDRMPLLKRGL
jgi:hypothetical protein